jgi:hypothetical protein
VPSEVQDSDQELSIVISRGRKRLEAGDFLVKLVKIKAFLWDVDAWEVNLIEDGSHCGKNRQIARDRGGQIDRLQFKRFVDSVGCHILSCRGRCSESHPPPSLIPQAHDQPPALLVAEIELRNGSGFGCLLVRRLDSPEILPALPNDRDAPASQLGAGASFSRYSCQICIG